MITLVTLTGCGLTQSIADRSSDLAQSIFYKRVNTLRLDFIPRSEINQDDHQHALSLVLRVYQLTDRQNFEQTDYASLLDRDQQILQPDLLASRELTIRPGANASLTQVMDPAADYVAIVALFRDPDLIADDWRLVIPRSELDADRATVIELNAHSLNVIQHPKRSAR